MISLCLSPESQEPVSREEEGAQGVPNTALAVLTGTTSTCHRWTWILPTALLGQENSGVCKRHGSPISWDKEGTGLVFITSEATQTPAGLLRGPLRGPLTLSGKTHLL